MKLGLKLAAAAAAAMVMAAPAVAVADGGHVWGRTVGDCGEADGNYQWFWTGNTQGRDLFRTEWDIHLKDLCDDNKSVGLYGKWWKFEGGAWRPHNASYNKLPLKGTGKDLDAVELYVCLNGYANTCKRI